MVIPQHLIYFFTIIKCYESNFSKNSMDIELNTSQILFLMEIYNREGINQIDLVRKFHVTEANISQSTKKLRENGLIVKKMDPENNSRNLLFLTEDGRDLCESLLVMFKEWNDNVTRDIPRDELISFSKTLGLLKDNCVDMF